MTAGGNIHGLTTATKTTMMQKNVKRNVAKRPKSLFTLLENAMNL